LLGGAPAAEDAAQEVFVRAYRSLSSYDPNQPFAAWVLRIASNHCIDLLRRRSKAPMLFGDFDTEFNDVQSADPTALDALIDAQRSDEVRAAIGTLPDKYRIPITLAYYNELNYDEIAAELSITRNHVGVLLLRARQSLRRALAASFGESQP
jgi:RNA polymerase sigma-70 factor (ECF subfamily)